MENNIRCPLCQRIVYQSIKTKSRVKDSDNFQTSLWKMCACGCVFNDEGHSPEFFNAEYRKDYSEIKGIEERQNYYIHVYAPLVEELTYGRKFLDAGYCLPFNIKAMRARGWLATGIDLITDPDFLTGDFLTYDFRGERFDFIKMTDFLQCVSDPLVVIRKAYDLLYPNGVLLISTPDTDMIKDNFFPEWGHWNAKENRQFVNGQILRDMLAKCGDSLNGKMEVKLEHRDISRRFVSWNNIHLIAQKNKREVMEVA